MRKRPELERWDFEFLMTSKGTPWNTNPSVGEMGADALPADMAVLMPAPAPVHPVVAAAAPVDREASRSYIKRADVQKYGYSMNCLGCRSVMTGTTARPMKRVAGGWRNVWLKTKKRNSGQKRQSFVLTAGWRVEPSQKATRSGETESNTPHGVAACSSAAPADPY